MSLQPEESGLRRLDLNLLPVFVALMRERSVTRAGRALFLSQPAASAALARLRAAFGDELFVRNGNALDATPRAEALMAELEPALRAVAGAVAGATPFDPATDARVFRIGWSDDVAIAAMPLLPRLREAAPHCRLVLRTANYRTVPAMLDSGEIGTAVCFMGDDLPATAKQRVLRRGNYRVLRDAASPGAGRPRRILRAAARAGDGARRPHGLRRHGVGAARPEPQGGARLAGFRPAAAGAAGERPVCTVSDALAEALVAQNAGGRHLAADALPFPRADWTVRMAWRGVLDHDPGEAWLRARIVEAMAR